MQRWWGTLCRPCGDGLNVLFKTRGPFIYISLVLLTHRMYAGTPFHIEVLGYVADLKCQPKGMQNLGQENVSSAIIEFNGKSPGCQKFQSVSGLDDAFFCLSMDCMLRTTGIDQIIVMISNPLSTFLSTLKIASLRSSPGELKITLLQQHQDTPSCLPFVAPSTKTHGMSVSATYLGASLTLQAYVREGIMVEFYWSFTENSNKEIEDKIIQIDCLLDLNCLSSTVNWTFETEGVHTVRVNASNTYGWTEETMQIVVVRHDVSDCTLVSVSGYQKATGQNIGLELKMFTTIRQLLLLNLTLTNEVDRIIDGSYYHSFDKDNNTNASDIRELEDNLAQKVDFNQSQNRGCDVNDNNPRCDRHSIDTFSLAGDPQASNPHLLFTYGQSNCYLHLHLHYQLPNTGRHYHLSASVFSITDPSVMLLSATLPRPIEVYERIRALWPVGTWNSVVPSQSELNLTVTSKTNSMGSRVLWTVTMDQTIVVNRTTKDWTAVFLLKAGHYQVTVKAYNPISWASFRTHFQVYDPVGEIVLNVPNLVTAQHRTLLSFAIKTGSNITVGLLMDETLIYQNHSYTIGEEVTLILHFDHVGTVVIVLRAENQVSSKNRTVCVYVQEDREPSHTENIDVDQPPITVYNPIISTAVRDQTTVTLDEPVGDVLLTLATPTVTRVSDFIIAMASVATDKIRVFEWQVLLPNHTIQKQIERNVSVTVLQLMASIPGTYHISLTASNSLGHASVSQHLEVTVHGAIGLIKVKFPLGSDHTALLQRSDGSSATKILQFRTHSASQGLHFVFYFGDGTPLSSVKGVSNQLGTTGTCHHQYRKEGKFPVGIWAYNEFYNSSMLERWFYVERAPAGLELTANSSQVQQNQVILFKANLESGTNVSYTWNMGDQTTYVNTGSTVSHLFLMAGLFEVCVSAGNRVGIVLHCVSVLVTNHLQFVKIYTERQVYPTDTDIVFQALTKVPDVIDFVWYFGDSPPIRTTVQNITRRYRTPDRYSVVMVASNSLISSTSEVLHLVVQRVVKLNKLVYQASVVQNQTVAFLCRVSDWTNLTYIWTFGDGTSRVGGHSEQHVFYRTGEFTVEVTVSNLVSSASLNGQIFIVACPCQPPPVKNMGPHKIQVRRSEAVHLGVTYEGEVRCDISQGVEYTWSLYDSTGQAVQLPPINTHRQSVTLPSYFLHYDTYTAIARVQIIGVVVYSNYSVLVRVIPTPPFAIIDGGTNVFLNNRNNTVISFNSQHSYDTDYSMNTLSYSWSCEPISSIASSCFDHYVPTSISTVEFPAGILKREFDQFKFKLTVRNGARSASSESFITVTPTLSRRVLVNCSQCQGDRVNWEQMFSVTAVCENCVATPENVVFSWSLYLVNGSSKVATDVPFCHTVDLSTPATINEGPEVLSAPTAIPTHQATLIRTTNPPTSTLLQPSQYSNISKLQTDTYPVEKGFKSGKHLAEKLNLTGASEMFQNTISSDRTNTIPASSKPPFETVLMDFQPSFAHSSTQTTSWSEEFDPPEPPYPFSEFSPVALDDGSILYSAPFGQNYIIAEFSTDPDQLTDINFPSLENGNMGGQPDLEANGTSLPVSSNQTEPPAFSDMDYDDTFLGIEEADPGVSVGRPASWEDESSSSRGDSYPASPGEGEEEGSNLVDSSPSLIIQKPTLLDLPRQLIDTDVFESYTFTGISGPRITFRPFSLRADSRYMLEVTASSNDVLLGKTQLFLVTNPIPKGMTCQVQPTSGLEIHTQFSIFCASGKKDLVYEYSYGTGDSPPKVFYHGRDFQYYFNLPSGQPDDDYKVRIYIRVRNGFGSATKPCLVTVRVRPSFMRNTSSNYDPDLELSDSGLSNLSAFVHLGSTVEISNYVMLLISVLNRLSLEPFAKIHTQTHTRDALISTLCQLEITNQGSMIDNICMLKDLMHITQQVTLVSASRVTSHIQSISERFHDPDVPALYDLDQWTVNTLVKLLSHSLLATANHFDPEPDSSSPDETAQTASVTAKEVVHLITNILETAVDLPLKYILLSKVKRHNVTTSVMAVKTTRHDSGLAPVIGGRQTTFYLPDSLDQLLFSRRDPLNGSEHCVLSQLTEFAQNPYLWANIPGQQRGPVVDLSFYNCSTRRVIPLRFLSQPVNIEFPRTPRNVSSIIMHTLMRDQINYHSFNVTQEQVKQAIQLNVVFKWPPNKAFPVMLLFSMFKKPTPSLYHLHRIHMMEGNTKHMHITLPPYYLHVGGIGYLALMNADYRKPPSYRYFSSHVNYSFTVEATQCLSWDRQGSWMHQGCLPQLERSTTAVNCSCNHSRSLTMVQQQLQTDFDSADLAKLVSLVRDLTLVSMLAVVVCLYALGVVVCKRADARSESSVGVHYLLDNSPSDPHLYAVTIHTGLHSASTMTAKVYIVLYGDGGVSQTRELQNPNHHLFKRNSRHTFIICTTESLGPLWGVHLWHDNSGSSPSWYLKQVEVCKVDQGKVKGPCWLFLGQCWLAVDKSDRHVERRLRISTHGIGFSKMLRLKLSDYMADSHLWVSVYTQLYPSVFTHIQRLSVCLQLLLGYTCFNALQISQLDDQYTFELGLIDVSAVSLTMGLLSVLAVLPMATGVSFLFRLRQVKLKRSAASKNQILQPDLKSVGANALSVSNSLLESYLSWSNLQQCAEDVWKKKYEVPGLASMSQRDLLNKKTVDRMQQGKAGYLFTEGGWDLGSQRDLAKKGNNLDLIIGPAGNEDVTQGKKDLLPWETREATLCAKEIQKKDFKDWVSDDNGSLGTLQQCNPVTDNASAQQDNEVFVDHVNNHNRYGLSGAIVKSFPCWCHILAWVLCLLLSLTYLVFTALLGTRFNSSQVLLWFHCLFFSLITCIFLVQPAMIFIVAVAVSLWYRKRTDFDSCFGITRFVTQALKLWRQDTTDQQAQLQHSTPYKPQDRGSYFEKVLAARQRARYLRLVRPPTQAQLRGNGGKRRKGALIQSTLRELALNGSMLFLLLCISYGRLSTDQYHLDKAVRTQFTSGPHNWFLSIQTPNEWWDWAKTSLLDGLHWNSSLSATGKAGAIQGTCNLLGEPILKKMEPYKSSDCQLPAERAGLVPGCLRGLTSEGEASGTFPTAGPRTRVGLGFTRVESLSRLEYLSSDGWLDGGVVSAQVQFTLYSPATNLLTSVILLVDHTSGGTLLPSVSVHSARVYHSPTAWDYGIMVCQLLFLVLTLLQLFGQMWSAEKRGLLGYWRTPCNWLEVSTLLISLVYYVYYVYHSILTHEVIDILQRHDYKEYVDVSLLSVCEQHTRTLCGVLLFLLAVKCVFVLSGNRTMAVPVSLLRLTLSSLLWPMVSGVVLLMAVFCMENLLFASLVFSSLPHSLKILLSYCRGPAGLRALSLSTLHHDPTSDSVSEVFCHGTICLCASFAWTALVIAVVSSLVKNAKRSNRSASLLTLSSIAVYIRERASVFVGQWRPKWTDSHPSPPNYYLEEFESLVDELLLRLDCALPCSLPLTLPPKASKYTVESFNISGTQNLFSLDSQHTISSSTLHTTRAMILNDLANLSLTDLEHTSGSDKSSSLLKLETLQILQHESKNRLIPNRTLSSGVAVPASFPQVGPGSGVNGSNLQMFTEGDCGPLFPTSDEHLPLVSTQKQNLFGSSVDQLSQCVVLENETFTSLFDKNAHGKGRKPGIAKGLRCSNTEVVEVMIHEQPRSARLEQGELDSLYTQYL